MKPASAVLCGMILILSSCCAQAQSTDYNLLRGDCCYAACQNDSALMYYERAYDKKPRSFEVLKRMAIVYNDGGRILLHSSPKAQEQYQKAVVYAQELLRNYPERAESHFCMALCLGSLIPFRGVKEKISDSKEVLSQLNTTLRLDSTMALAYVLLGVFWREAASLSWLEKTFVNVFYGESFNQTVQDSEQALLHAIYLDPSCSYAYYELYWTYKAMGKKALAAKNLADVLSLFPANMREKKQQEEAKEEWNLAIAGK